MAAVCRGLVESLKEVVFFLAISVGLFVLGLVPAIGVGVPLIALPFMWYSLAFTTITPCMSDRDLSFRQKRTVLGANHWAVFGFGSACFLMFFIPLAGFVLLPVAVVGGALLFHERLAGNEAGQGDEESRKQEGRS